MIDLSSYTILGAVRGIASGYGVKTLSMVPFVFEPGSWSPVVGQIVRLMWTHQHEKLPIGVVMHMMDTQDGLYFEAVVVDAPGAEDIYQAIQARMVEEVSVSFLVDDLEYEWDEEDEAIHISAVRTLKEISAVNFGANPRTTLEAVDLTDDQKKDIVDLLRQKTA